MFKMIFLGLSLTTLSTAGFAEPVTESRVLVIADLDLATSAGQAKLDQRINEACGEASIADLAGRNDVQFCRANARANAERLIALRQSAQAPVRIASADK